MRWRDLIKHIPEDKLDHEVLIVPRDENAAYSIASIGFEVVDIDGNIGEDAKPGHQTVECILIMAD